MKFLPLFLCFINGFAFAQSGSGTISNTDNQPIDDADVFNLRTGNHTHSDEKGAFTLADAVIGDTLNVIHFNYKSVKVVNNGLPLTVVLSAQTLLLNEVNITASLNQLNTIADLDLRTQPVNSAQDLLRKVPGLFIGQHAGGGKAEQLFLRGFDIDHGTDINISVDGMPVNMVSHAHGQGYADLHFLIPETVDKIDFDKGSYYANKGNLNTAGYVAFKTKDRLDSTSIGIELGMFRQFRANTMFSIINNAKQSLYVATDFYKTNSYFESSQNFYRYNAFAKYTEYLPNNDKVSLSFGHFSSRWSASGQIPERAVADGSITDFGSIDNTEGGNTSRTNLNLLYLKNINPHTYIKNTAFYSNYNFELYSNFTFFLNDSINGDQIRQKERRNLLGFQSELIHDTQVGNAAIQWQAGIGMRNDATNDTELSRTKNRAETLQNIKLGDIEETNLYAYISNNITIGKWLINPALRLDEFKFDYTDKLAPKLQTATQTQVTLSPKLNFLYHYNNKLQFFLKTGKGFHSNDARIVTTQIDKKVLPAAYTADLGTVYKPIPRMIVNAALWYLFSEQEFVYVGDEGIVELGGKTERRGIDLGARYQITRHFYLNADATYNTAKALDAPEGANRIPLAPVATALVGLSILNYHGFSAGINSRYLGDRPANDDNSLIAKGYVVTDANANYRIKNGVTVGISVQNVFNTRWKETQFATESRLKNEPESVTEIHYTAGTPFNARLQLTYRF